MIDVKILSDSVSTAGNRITTFILTYPRFIHAEFMTHRMLSRNTSSSRARPAKQLIKEAEQAPAMPMFWGKNQSGMQSFQELTGLELELCQSIWNAARRSSVRKAKELDKLGLHKQYINRILEPYTHITVVCTATDYANFFNLRADKEAMPEIQILAYEMLEAYKNSKPAKKKVGEWHLPFADKYINEKLGIDKLLKICTARAARVSYLNFEGDIDHNKDYVLHDRLAESGHWSPFEHAAQAERGSSYSANFKGWKQYRKFFSKENRTDLNIEALLSERGKYGKAN
jgi:thymidylate synthase ThyX